MVGILGRIKRGLLFIASVIGILSLLRFGESSDQRSSSDGHASLSVQQRFIDVDRELALVDYRYEELLHSSDDLEQHYGDDYNYDESNWDNDNWSSDWSSSSWDTYDYGGSWDSGSSSSWDSY